jgi:hypothetical protein
MATFTVNFDFEMSEEEERLLRNILGDIDPQKTFEEILSDFSKASFEEYYRMFLGQKVFTRGSDFQEYRLFLIIKRALENDIPSEELVSSLFQLTASQSRSLIRSVLSKYQYELHDALKNTLVKVLQNAQEVQSNSGRTSEYTIDVRNKSIVSELNQLLGNIDGNLPQITQKRGTYSKYIVSVASYRALCEKLEVTEGENQEQPQGV